VNSLVDLCQPKRLKIAILFENMRLPHHLEAAYVSWIFLTLANYMMCDLAKYLLLIMIAWL